MSHKSGCALMLLIGLLWLGLLLTTAPTWPGWQNAPGTSTPWSAPTVVAPQFTLTPTPSWWATVLPTDPHQP